MLLVKVKEKYQVTIPNEIRNAIGLEVGDVLEAVIEKHQIVLKPKTLVDRESIEGAIAEGLADVKAGRVIGPFNNMAEYHEYKGKQKK